MFCVPLLACRPLGPSALGLLALLAATLGAEAADIDYDDPPPIVRRYDPPSASYRGRVHEEPQVERCRIVHRRAFDEYGREIIRRIRECDEGVLAWRPLPRYRDAPRVYDAPPRHYRDYDYDAPRPPRDLDPYDDPD